MSEAGQRGDGQVLAPAPRCPVQHLAAPPTFSVVIAAYEASATVGDAVRSALDQTLPAHEVIVVDDGSMDDVSPSLRPFGSEVTLLHRKHGGAAAARNTGIEVASGDFVAFLDADDRFHPRRLESLAELARQRPDLDLISTDMRFVVDGQTVGSFLADNAFAVEDQRGAILKSCFVGAPPAVRLTRLRAIGGFDESLRLAEDWDCWLRLILGGSLAGLVDRPYYDYVLHPGALTSSRIDSLWARVRMLEKAAVDPSLTEAERRLVENEMRRRRSDAVSAAARSAPAGSRARFARLAFGPRLSPPARAAALLALVSPRLARRLLRGREAPGERLAAKGSGEN